MAVEVALLCCAVLCCTILYKFIQDVDLNGLKLVSESKSNVSEL